MSRPRPSNLDEATEWFRRRVPMTKAAWLALDAKAKEFGFFAADIGQLALVMDLQKAVEKAVRKGTTLAEFKRDVAKRLEQEWGAAVPNPGARLETIFRTNVQKAYNAGRWKQYREPAVARARPYLMVVPVLDARTTVVCKALAGHCRPASDPWWRTHWPPYHYNCRTTVRALSATEAGEAGISRRKPSEEPMEGFGGVEDDFALDTTGVPSRFAQALKGRK